MDGNSDRNSNSNRNSKQFKSWSFLVTQEVAVHNELNALEDRLLISFHVGEQHLSGGKGYISLEISRFQIGEIEKFPVSDFGGKYSEDEND